MQNRGIIFDFDGVVIDSLEVQRTAFLTCYQEHFHVTGEAAFEEFLSYGGDSLENIFHIMDLPPSLLKKYRGISTRGINRIKIYPGIIEVLQTLKKLENIRICLFTGKDCKRTDEILKYLNLEEYFDEVICSDQIKKPKPDKEGIDLIAQRFHLNKNDMIMIGDAPNDIICAKNAGVKSIAALWGNPKLDVKKLKPVYTAKNPEDLPELINRMITERKTIAVINGPNINYLGKREQNFYGLCTWNEIECRLKEMSMAAEYDLVFFQSNSESDIVDFIQMQHENIHAVIINPASLTISGYSILEAIHLFELPFIEVHMSNIFSREKWHSKSVFSPFAHGIISGLKEEVYYLAFQAFVNGKNAKK